MKSLYTVELHRSDLMELEGYLAEALRRILPFTSYSLYFPTAENTPQEPQWITQERSLLLPLWYKEKPFGVFMARGANARTVKKLLPTLEALTTLCMEHLLCIKQSRTDELTGLARMPRLLERMEHDADMVRSYYDGGMDTEQKAPLHKACMALVVVRCPALDSLASEFGYTFAHTALSAWAKALQQDLPQEVLAARSGENECTLLLPTATRTSCSKFTEDIMARADAVTLTHAPTKRQIRLHSVAGFALYPQDMEISRMNLGMAEQVHQILHKARYAAHMAYVRSRFLSKEEKNQIQSRHLAYARVLAQGGIVQEELSLRQLLTNLGRHAGAKEGQHFSVWGYRNGSWQRKGEVVLMEVRNAHAIAEVLHHYDPTWAWEKGDNLRLSDAKTPATLTEKISSRAQENPLAQEDSAVQESTTILSHGDFLRKLTESYEDQTSFSLALLRLSPEAGESTDATDTERFLPLYTQWLQEFHAKNTVPFENKESTAPLLMGRYGETSFIFYHAGITSQKLETAYKDLCQKALEAGLHLAVGIASYPCLQAHKGDILDYCHKALDLALLLQEPKVGTIGTLAFNISADQRYSRGDVFGAVEEYKQALLADPNNAMAWNSLGVCMAALSRYSEARSHFKEALKLWKDSEKESLMQTIPSCSTSQIELAATLYNLGTVCQNLGENRAAAKHFKDCIESNSSHYFAHIRLGQLAEQAGKLGQARQYYAQGVALEKQEQQGSTSAPQKKAHAGIAYRHLAKVSLQQGKHAEARELLHETLLHNPQDAVALCLLAEIYLQGGEDPSMAEMLARKSVGLRPEYALAWRVLGQSLRALGREDDALNAEDRAVTL